MSTLPKTYISPEQYLEIERKAEYKSEYYRGEMFAMAGASWAHSVIVSNLVGELREQLRDKPCTVSSSDLRVRVAPTGLYTYPDVVMVCGEPQFVDVRQDTILNPRLIIEVLSPSTEAYDRGKKFQHYRALKSLQQYLLVASDRMYTDLFTLHPGGSWTLTSKCCPEETLELDAVDCRIKLAAIYEKLALAEAPLHPPQDQR